MYDHLGLKVHDLAASIRFYQAALAPLGHVLGSSDDTCAGLGPRDAPALWLYAHQGSKGKGTHIAFRAATPAQVDAFYEAGLKAGAADNGGPGPPAGLQPHLLRRLPDRPRRQQRGGGVPVKGG